MTTFGPFYCIWAYWSLIENLTQFLKIFQSWACFVFCLWLLL